MGDIIKEYLDYSQMDVSFLKKVKFNSGVLSFETSNGKKVKLSWMIIIYHLPANVCRTDGWGCGKSDWKCGKIELYGNKFLYIGRTQADWF